MPTTPDPHRDVHERRLRDYLLAELPDNEREQLEADFFGDDQLFDGLCAVEDELVDDYVTGALSDEERQRFQTHFLTTPERQRKVLLASGIQRAQPVDSEVSRVPFAHPTRWWAKTLPRWPTWRLVLVASPVAVIVAVLLIQVGMRIWIAPQQARPVVLASLQDTGGAVTIGSDRTVILAALGPLPGPLAHSVDQFVTTGGLALTPGAEAASTAMRGDPTRRAFPGVDSGPVPVTPAGTGIRSGRPTLHWRTVAGAREYTLVIVDEERQPVWQASAGMQNQLTLPSRVLQAGRVYFWQVEATVDGQRVTGPAAGFWLIDGESLQAIERLERAYQGSALVRAAMYAERGLYEEALGQVERLEQLNPQHPQVRAMRDFLYLQLGRQ